MNNTTYNQIEYSGDYSDRQIRGHKYQQPSFNSYNDYQIFLYNRALHGLDAYTPEEVKKMHWDKRKRIENVHQRAKLIINRWKQVLITYKTNEFLTKLLPNAKLTKEFIAPSNNYTDDNYNANVSLKELGITKQDIINKLMEEKILPKNYLTLKPLEPCM